MATSQYKMVCFAWSSKVLGPRVMYKDFRYSIFKQQWSFMSNHQFNGADDHQNKENHTVSLSFFHKGNHLHSIVACSMDFFQYFHNHFSHRRVDHECKGHFISMSLFLLGKHFASITFII